MGGGRRLGGVRGLCTSAAEGEWEDPRPGWAEDRLRCFVRLQGGVNAACRVREALAQGVGSAQVLEGLMAGRERLVRVVRLGWRSGRAALLQRIGMWSAPGRCW